MLPPVTVLVPTLNRGRLLTSAVQSALSQHGVDVRVHIADDASDAAASGVGRSLAEDPRVTYHRNPSRLGAIENFNRAISRVETPTFLLLGDDDRLLPGALCHLSTALAQHPSAAFATGIVEFASASEERLGRMPSWTRAGPYPHGTSVREFFPNSFPLFIATLFRSNVVADLQLDPDAGLLVDVDFMLRVALRHEVVRVEELCSVGGVHDATASTAASEGALLESWTSLQRRVLGWDAPTEERNAVVDLIQQNTATFAWSVVVDALRRGDRAAARASIRHLRVAPSRRRYHMARTALLLGPIGTLGVRVRRSLGPRRDGARTPPY